MNDWPDVFIHTNQDTPDNMDATRLQRVAVIGAASGYFLASAGPAEGKNWQAKSSLEAVPLVKLDGTLAYEALTLAEGRRSVTEIHNMLRAAYGEGALQDLLDYFKLLEKAGVVSIRGLP